MPRPATLLLLAAAVSSGGSGCIYATDDTDVASDQLAIVSGTVDTGDPAVALLDLGDGICTGTLISPKVIVTAQHCLTGPATDITAHFVNEFGAVGPMASATASETHPNSDIGAIALAEPVAGITPIPLNTTPLESALGQPVRFVGFGVTSEEGADSGLKRQGASTLSSTAPDGVDWYQGEMATATGGQSTCYGDSGGPNFMTFAGVEYIAGITSRGTGICGVGLDIAVRIDAHADFLRSFIERNDAAGAACAADSTCTQGCATVDPDCCVADGACVDECGSADADCGSTDPGAAADGDRHFEGGCNAGGGAPRAVWAVALVLAMAMFRRRRRRLEPR